MANHQDDTARMARNQDDIAICTGLDCPLRGVGEQLAALAAQLQDFRKEVIGNGVDGRIQRIEKAFLAADERLRYLEIHGAEPLGRSLQQLNDALSRIEARGETEIAEVKKSASALAASVADLQGNRQWFAGRRGVIAAILSAVLAVATLGTGQTVSYFLSAHQRSLDRQQTTESEQALQELQTQVQKMQVELNRHEQESRQPAGHRPGP